MDDCLVTLLYFKGGWIYTIESCPGSCTCLDSAPPAYTISINRSSAKQGP